MVVAIMPEADSAARKAMETDMVYALRNLNYQAVSAVAVFGPQGLANSGEENTYLKLCDSGIDAVMTLALIHKTKETWRQTGNVYARPNDYYYQRIWNYKKIAAGTIETGEKPEYFWENILFDLLTLEAVCTIRTQPFTKANQVKTTGNLTEQVIKKLLKEKVLKKQPTPASLKAF